MYIDQPVMLLSMPQGAEVFAGLTVAFIVMGIALIPIIFFLLTLQNTLKAVSPQNREMPPGQVWLQLIPVFHYVWQFINVNNIAKSLEKEYRSRGIQTEPKPTYNIGLAYCILVCCSIIPGINIFTGLAAFICWIIYWVQVNNHKNKLAQLPNTAQDENSAIFGTPA